MRLAPSLRAQRSNPESFRGGGLDCFVASAQNCFAILSRAPRNDGIEAVALYRARLPASPSRRRRHGAVGVARPVGRGRLRRPECGVGVAYRLSDGSRLRLAGVVAVAGCGGLDGGGGNQRCAENGESLLHRCFSRDDAPAVRHDFVVAADMAMGPAKYQQRRPHDRKRSHHVAASKFFGPG